MHSLSHKRPTDGLDSVDFDPTVRLRTPHRQFSTMPRVAPHRPKSDEAAGRDKTRHRPTGVAGRFGGNGGGRPVGVLLAILLLLSGVMANALPAQAQSPPATAPPAPQQLEARAADGRVDLAWSAPADDGGSELLRYEIRRAAGASVPDDTRWTELALNRTYSFGDLDNGELYSFQVRAVNARGAGPAAQVEATPARPAEITGVSITSNPGDGAYNHADMMEATVTFDTAVTVTGSPGLKLRIGSSDPVEASYAPDESTGTALVFRYTVDARADDAPGLSAVEDSLSLNGGAIANAAYRGVAARLDHPGATQQVPVRTRMVTGFRLTSKPVVHPALVQQITYGVGETLEIAIDFANAVDVLGTPKLHVVRKDDENGEVDTVFAYEDGSGTQTLRFRWTVPDTYPETDEATEWEVRENDGTNKGLDLAGATLQDGNGLAVNTRHETFLGMRHEAYSHLSYANDPMYIDNLAPAAIEATAHGDHIDLILRDARHTDRVDDLHGQAGLAPALYGVTADGSPVQVSEVEFVDDDRVRLVLGAPVGDDRTVTVAYTAPSGGAPTAGLVDQWSNRVASFSITIDPAASNNPQRPPPDIDDTPVGPTHEDSGPAGPAAPAALTAHFSNVPDEHDGSTPFTVEIVFSEALAGMGNRAIRAALAVDGGATTGVRRVNLDKAHHIAKIKPDGLGPVTVSFPPTLDCVDEGALCTASGGRLETGISTGIPGPAALSVADARMEESADAALAFAVTLDRAAAATVRVHYATADGTAAAGADYIAVSGTLAFALGETAKTVRVRVLDDSHDEGREFLLVVLSNASGAYIADGEATGTIEDSDPMPQAWLGRFGRTVAEHVLEAVEDRVGTAPRPGVEAAVAGQRIFGGGSPGAEADAQAGLDALARSLRDETDESRAGRAVSGSVAPRDLLSGSSFALAAGGDGSGGGIASLWGRGALSGFEGREGELSLSGEVASAMAGADWTHGSGAGSWTAGLILSHSRGEGEYRGASDSGSVSSTLTGLFPWGRYALNERLSVWGVAGYGEGELTLTPDGQASIRTGLDLAMVSSGLRGVLVQAPETGGLELALKTDGLLVRTNSAAASGLAAASGDATRFRLGVEGSRSFRFEDGGALSPSAELGVRHDGGDAENGFGLDLGAGLAWSHPASGISAELHGRGLLTHESRGFRIRGISGSFAWDPDPASERGPSLAFNHAVGGSASGGMDALLGRETLAGLAANDNDAALQNRRLELKLGYGFSALGDRFTSTPEIGIGFGRDHREYTVGWRLGISQGGPAALEFGLEASRREHAGEHADPEHGIGFRVNARW